MKGILYIVPTPIGNLEDITLRALKILGTVDLIAAEDTRYTHKLLNHYKIKTPTISLHAHNEHKIVSKIINQIKIENKNVAVVSDSGMPGICDPAYLIINKAIDNEINICTLPGPSAFVPALINSGLPNHQFTFEGFLPFKKGRLTKLNELKDEYRTMIFYESPHRLLKTLNQFIEIFGGDRLASISREISKVYEETLRANLNDLKKHFEENPIKGEFVLVVAGKK